MMRNRSSAISSLPEVRGQGFAVEAAAAARDHAAAAFSAPASLVSYVDADNLTRQVGSPNAPRRRAR